MMIDWLLIDWPDFVNLKGKYSKITQSLSHYVNSYHKNSLKWKLSGHCTIKSTDKRIFFKYCVQYWKFMVSITSLSFGQRHLASEFEFCSIWDFSRSFNTVATQKSTHKMILKKLQHIGKTLIISCKQGEQKKQTKMVIV